MDKHIFLLYAVITISLSFGSKALLSLDEAMVDFLANQMSNDQIIDYISLQKLYNTPQNSIQRLSLKINM